MTKQELIALGLSEEAADKILKDHIPYERFKQVNDEKNAMGETITKKDAEIATLNETIKAGESVSAENETLKKELASKNDELYAAKKDSAIKMAIGQAKAKNIKAVQALLDEGKLEMQDDGNIKGLTEALETLKKSDGYLFDLGASSNGFNPGGNGGSNEAPTTLAGAVKAAIEKQ